VQNVLALALYLAQIFVGAYHGDEEVVGEVANHVVENDESLMEIARQYGVGYEQMIAANPGVDPFVPGNGKVVTVPTAWIVPRVAPGIIIINLSELRLYYRMVTEAGAQSLLTFPVGIGDEGFDTPVGTYQIVKKETQPTWYVPPSIRAERPDLPPAVPPGPDNPLGTHALRLSSRNILIHGTNRPFGVGRRASHGCIRLYPEDIPVLFGLVRIGTRVRVVREPVKVGTRGDRIYLEVHADDGANLDYARQVAALLAWRGLSSGVDPVKIQIALDEKRGIPIDVSK
jgi:L,D-transpeptidase ErfK/SrfK